MIIRAGLPGGEIAKIKAAEAEAYTGDHQADSAETSGHDEKNFGWFHMGAPVLNNQAIHFLRLKLFRMTSASQTVKRSSS